MAPEPSGAQLSQIIMAQVKLPQAPQTPQASGAQGDKQVVRKVQAEQRAWVAEKSGDW